MVPFTSRPSASLAPYLTPANQVDLLDSAKYKTKRDVEQLIARVRPQADAPTVVRKLPAPATSLISEPSHVETTMPLVPLAPVEFAAAPAPTRPAMIKPLGPARFKVQFTVGRETHDKLRQAQDLLRHTIPNGDPAAIFDRALTLLLANLAKTKFAATDRPRAGREATRGSRHIPAAVRREVWRRDGGTCAFVGVQGRCGETARMRMAERRPLRISSFDVAQITNMKRSSGSVRPAVRTPENCLRHLAQNHTRSRPKISS